MIIRKVDGPSMQPTLYAEDVVVAFKKKLRVGSIVLAHISGRDVVKRIERLDTDGCYLVGDNSLESTDSRHYGKIRQDAILGTVMITLPRAVSPPQLVKPSGVWLGRIIALILVIMTLAQLYRIDTFVPLLDSALPGGDGSARMLAIFIILSEMFALPFALRVKLSPLGHLVSGALVVIAPLWWVLIHVWLVGTNTMSGQLGEFVPVPSTVAVLAFNILWLLLSYMTLYCLGYNRLNFKSVLRK